MKLRKEKHGQTVTKQCKHCHQVKPDSEFIKADGRHRATRNRCKSCAKHQSQIRKQLKRQHPPPQPGLCPVCNMFTSYWVLDHCHNDDRFRGYICRSCNAGIGLLHDDPSIVTRALNYLVAPFNGP